MSELKLIRMLRDLFARHGSRRDIEPSAVCPKHRDEIPEDQRLLYYEFQRPQRCAICGVAMTAEEATAFDG